MWLHVYYIFIANNSRNKTPTSRRTPQAVAHTAKRAEVVSANCGFSGSTR